MEHRVETYVTLVTYQKKKDYINTTPNTTPSSTIKGDGIFVKTSRQNVAIVTAKFNSELSSG